LKRLPLSIASQKQAKQILANDQQLQRTSLLIDKQGSNRSLNPEASGKPRRKLAKVS